MSRIDELETFVRIVDAGSITEAAEQLGVAKSGVSRRLRGLERRLGARLLNRTTRRSSLTDAGRAYYEGAVRLLADFEELDQSVAQQESALEGRLRLALPLSFGLCHLSPAIEAFAREHPGLEMQLDFSDHVVNLVEGGFDLGIRISQLKDSSLQARRICPVRLLYCASPGYLRHHGKPQTPADLRHHDFLRYDASDAPRLGRTRMSANNGDFLVDMAIAGHGVILTPSFIAWKALAKGELVTVLDEFRPEPLAAYAVYPQNRYLSRRARVLIDYLAERFGENPYWDQFL
jgi:DNA-binding transcriptional LysR family regulator